jgi:hypothetical protein
MIARKACLQRLSSRLRSGVWASLFLLGLLVGYLALLTVLLEDYQAQRRVWRERIVQEMNVG